MSKTVLVTGGCGLIGSHLCYHLTQQGHTVLCLDNLLTGRLSNIKRLEGALNFHLIEQDVCAPIDHKVDEIFNLACPASPIHYQRAPIDTMKTSVLGAINMLELARRYNATILQASTSEVYGDPNVHPQPETYWGHVNPIGIRSCYDEGKRAAESLFFDFHRVHHLPIKVVRIFNTYGPHMAENDGRVISNFIIQALTNESITIYGDGSQTRSFCYIDDLIKGLLLMMASKKRCAGPINLGNPKEFTIIELANKIITLSNSQSALTFKSLPDDDPRRRRPNINKAHTQLGWQPETSLEAGLVRTINHFKKRINKFDPISV